MKITVVAAGKIKESYLTQGISEFQKRLAPFARLEIVEIGEERLGEDPSPAEKVQALSREGHRLLQRVPAGSYLFVLDVAGAARSSEELAARIASLALEGKSDLTFLIGGPFGLSKDVREAAAERLSFSRMTFTHQMVRFLLLEQLYRAFKINRGEKYHW